MPAFPKKIANAQNGSSRDRMPDHDGHAFEHKTRKQRYYNDYQQVTTKGACLKGAVNKENVAQHQCGRQPGSAVNDRDPQQCPQTVAIEWAWQE